MEINTKIDASLASLNAYNEIYKWIPNQEQIRPTEIIITLFARGEFNGKTQRQSKNESKGINNVVRSFNK